MRRLLDWFNKPLTCEESEKGCLIVIAFGVVLMALLLVIAALIAIGVITPHVEAQR